MTDREKVINGLQCIIDGTVRCESCGYAIDKHGHHSCQQNCASDAIALLKQEPKLVKTDMYGNAYCPWCSTKKTIEMGVQKLHIGTQFCPYCGKVVKWDD